MERLRQRNIRAEVVIPWYIEQKLHPGWQEWFDRFVDGRSQRINSDFRPVGSFTASPTGALSLPLSLRGLFRQLEKVNLWAPAALLVVALLCTFLALWSKRRRSLRAGVLFAVITTGLAGMLFDLTLIFAFQSVYGYVFSWIGPAGCRVYGRSGLRCPAGLRALERIQNSFPLFLKTELSIMGFAVACPLVLLAVHAFLERVNASLLSRWLFLALSFTGGLLISAQFPLANHLLLKERGGFTPTARVAVCFGPAGGMAGRGDRRGGAPAASRPSGYGYCCGAVEIEQFCGYHVGWATVVRRWVMSDWVPERSPGENS